MELVLTEKKAPGPASKVRSRGEVSFAGAREESHVELKPIELVDSPIALSVMGTVAELIS